MTGPLDAAAEGGLTNTTNYLIEQGLHPRIAVEVARNVGEILYPWVLISTYAQMADELRDAGHVAVADTLDGLRHAHLSALMDGSP